MSKASPHQFRTRNAPTKAQRTRSNSNEKTAKSTNLIDIPPLITVWLQVRVLPGPPHQFSARVRKHPSSFVEATWKETKYGAPPTLRNGCLIVDE
jgi:hypothetical protein